MMTLGNMRVNGVRIFNRHLLLVAGWMLMFAGHAVAEEDISSANYVMIGCRNFLSQSPNARLLQGLCAGAVRGIAETDPNVCANGSVADLIRVVVAYVDSKPERLQENFNKLAQQALRQAWPCSKT